jgi:hypothetical protein
LSHASEPSCLSWQGLLWLTFAVLMQTIAVVSGYIPYLGHLNINSLQTCFILDFSGESSFIALTLM